ncbi:TPA: glycosyltransferase [Candidatus Bathyarchaeota archaeon]|nr:glycosyltransferase [Candidatus Bathyarchaeota archaeon]HIJ08256.1 glycosyltransferase [Candidatus Bathyarchaeota archaeon]
MVEKRAAAQEQAFPRKRECIAYLSSYPPRECGIATFTKDLLGAIDELSVCKQVVIAVNEKGAIYQYEKRVKFVIERDSIEDYTNAASYINASNVDLVSLQHEFGLFGGNYGENICYFLEKVKKPVVTTLHTVEPNFESKAQEVLRNIVAKSESVVVIPRIATGLLREQGLPIKKCFVIPHGCPDIPFVKSDKIKSSIGLRDRFVISTFGLLSRSKGIEYAIRALPSVVENEPKAIYLVIGETHPEVRKHEGEKYRKKLMKLVDELGLGNYVRFHNRFLSKRELINHLQATDIYVTPYISPNQISSGTLTFALGAGRAVVSTPYLHAQEALAGGRGLFCKFNNSRTVADCINKLLNENLREKIQAKAYKYSRRFVWSNVANQYVKLFKKSISRHRRAHL